MCSCKQVGCEAYISSGQFNPKTFCLPCCKPCELFSCVFMYGSSKQDDKFPLPFTKHAQASSQSPTSFLMQTVLFWIYHRSLI